MDDAVRSLGRFVAERRETLGMSQTELGNEIDRTQKWISNFERGVVVNVPDPPVMKKLAATLHCTVYDLLNAAGYIDAASEERFRQLEESATIYDVQRTLEAAENELVRARKAVESLLAERVGSVTRTGKS